MAKAATKKKKTLKKSARVTAKAAARSAKPAKKSAAKPARAAAITAKPIDPLNRTQYQSITPMLSVRDIRKAVDFYTSAFGFTVRGIMDGPQGPMHAELRLRDATLMLGPEVREQNALSANSIGNTPVTLYLLVEDVDKTFEAAVGAGGKAVMPVGDAFWGDRCGVIADPEGNKWMIATHKSEPTEAEMAEALRQMMSQQPAHAAAAAAGQ